MKVCSNPNGPVLVTGASGFLGRHVVRLLLENRQTVVATYSAPGAEADALQKAFPDSFEPLAVDFRRDITGDPFANRHFRAVVHLASYVPSYRTNNLLEELAEAHNGVLGAILRLLPAIQGRHDMLVFASSVTVYGATGSNVCNEQTDCQPTSIYGTFKLAGEGVCRCFAQSEKINLGVLRITQLWGAGEPHGLFLQRVFLPHARQCETINLVRGGRDEKDLLWVTDAAEAVVEVTEKRVNGTFNIASGQRVSILRIAELIRELSGKEFSIEISDDGQPSLSQAYDFRRAREAFGWKPRVDMKEGLRRLLQS